jgi:phosphatidylserine/phosphatidylglycerophosphate/cardiolipin synthase-like enzyme
VYCGPPAPGTRSRDFLDQVRDLIAGATKSIDVYGLSTTDDRALLRTIGALMSGRDVKVRLVFDAKNLDEPVASVRRHVAAGFGSYGALEVFASVRAAFRARVVVVDDNKTWVSGGELTTHEDDGFIDIGVVFSDSAYNRALAEEFQRLVAVGECVPVPLVDAS